MKDNRLVIQNINIFNSDSGEFDANKTIVVENQKITWIGNESQFEKTNLDQIINGENKFCIPGLIDCHVHLDGTSTLNYEREFLRTKTTMYGYTALLNARKHLISGFTTLRDCGGLLWGSTLREVFREKMFYGPRLLVAQHTIGQWGNQEDMGPDEIIDAYKKYETLSGVDGVIHAVRERKRQGSDFIKTLTTGGVLHGVESQLNRSLFNDEELKAMVTEAHRIGMHLACHAHGDEGILRASIAGIDTVEHGSFISEETAKIMVQNGTYLVPTQTSAFINKPDVMKNIAPEVQKKTIEVDKAMFENHKMAFEKGVKIALGTDVGVPGNFHGESAKEITSMVEVVGMTPSQAILCATREAAIATKQYQYIGSIEVGKFADFCILSNNPINDIKILEDKSIIDYVIKDGEVMVKSGIIQDKV